MITSLEFIDNMRNIIDQCLHILKQIHSMLNFQEILKSVCPGIDVVYLATPKYNFVINICRRHY